MESITIWKTTLRLYFNKYCTSDGHGCNFYTESVDAILLEKE